MVRVTAKILGEDYTIRGRAPQEHIERVARYVDERMLEIAEAYPKLGTSRVAVLAAINMADELFKIREQYEQLTQLLEEEWSHRHGVAQDGPAPEGRKQAGPSARRVSLPSAAAAETAAGLVGGPTQVPAFDDDGDRVRGHVFTGDALDSASGTDVADDDEDQ